MDEIKKELKHSPKRHGRPGPAPVAKEDLTKLLNEQLPKLQDLQQRINSTIEMIKNSGRIDVSILTIEAVKACLLEFEKEDPKAVLKSIHRLMIGRLKTKTKELE